MRTLILFALRNKMLSFLISESTLKGYFGAFLRRIQVLFSKNKREVLVFSLPSLFSSPMCLEWPGSGSSASLLCLSLCSITYGQLAKSSNLFRQMWRFQGTRSAWISGNTVLILILIKCLILSPWTVFSSFVSALANEPNAKAPPISEYAITFLINSDNTDLFPDAINLTELASHLSKMIL